MEEGGRNLGMQFPERYLGYGRSLPGWLWMRCGRAWIAERGVVDRSVENAPSELARLIALAERRLGKALDRALGTLGTSAAQRSVLEVLWQRGECSAAELAKAAHVEGPPMSRMLRRMESAGLIKRRDDPGDRRRQLIGLTAKGERLREVLPGVAESAMAKALDHLAPERRARLREDLALLVAALEHEGRGRTV